MDRQFTRGLSRTPRVPSLLVFAFAAITCGLSACGGGGGGDSGGGGNGGGGTGGG